VVNVTKPEIGLSMLYCLNEPFTYVLEHLADFNVKHVELADEGLHTLNPTRVKQLKAAVQDHDLDFVVHAPWASMNIATPNPDLHHVTMKRLKNSISFAGQLGCRLWLFHPGSRTGLSHIYPGEDWQLNLQSVQDLLKFARKEGVEIAIENTPEPFPSLLKNVDDFNRFYQELNDDIGLVLDVAHANINNQINKFLEQFSKKLVHIHVSDNDSVTDLHLGVGYGNINWTNVAKAVKNANYSNLVMVESTEHVKESLQLLRELFV
jgi:sugar phosphate isomerase/epimerase